MRTGHRLIVSVLLLAFFGAGVPLLEVWLKCRQPVSEACVWAKSYLPLSFGIGSVIGLVAAVAAWFVLGAWREK